MLLVHDPHPRTYFDLWAAFSFAPIFHRINGDGCLALIREVGSMVITKISVNVFIGLAGT
jgi:hypothetical protein